MIIKEHLSNKRHAHFFYDTDFKQKDNFKKAFDIILRLANEGKINSEELNTLLSFYATQLIEREIENRVDFFVTSNFDKFFEKRFLND